MSAVYAFARRVDDIGDDAGPAPAERLAALAAQREVVAAVARGAADDVDDPVAIALAHAHAAFGLPVDALVSLIDGVELDVLGTPYESFDELVHYCRCVAGSIGRLCLAIFAPNRPASSAPRAAEPPRDLASQAEGLADDLGVAMQLTNILRDVREDGERGRVYLPAADLRRFGCESLADAPPHCVADLIRFEAARAGEWFDRGLRLADVLDARSTSCLLAMTGIYRDILDRIARDPLSVLQGRVSLSTWEKAWVAARCLAVAEATAAMAWTRAAGGVG
jgi:phytoene synthase